MLMLSRKPGTAIVINGPATIHFVRVEGDRTTVGIETDPSISIVRKELIDRSGESLQTFRYGRTERQKDLKK
jgi:carbon storage regulator CsrA